MLTASYSTRTCTTPLMAYSVRIHEKGSQREISPIGGGVRRSKGKTRTSRRLGARGGGRYYVTNPTESHVLDIITEQGQRLLALALYHPGSSFGVLTRTGYTCSQSGLISGDSY